MFLYTSALIMMIIIIGFLGCTKKNRLHVDVSEIKVTPEFLHFEDALFSIPDSLFSEQFPLIFPAYAGLFKSNVADSLMTSEMFLFVSEPRFEELYQRRHEVLKDMEKEKAEIENLLKHYRYHYGNVPDYTIYTHISGLDLALLSMPVTVNDSIAVISTDFFLGSDFEPYRFVGIPEYRRRWMTPSQIAPEFARQLAFLRLGSPDEAETVLEQMIYQGKILYFLDAMMPEAHDSLKIQYSKQQLEWIGKNQRHVWSYLVNNQMLFSTDLKHNKMMILDAPFTPAFTENSPGRLGHWFGWNIVKRYMNKNPQITIPQLMEDTDAARILSESGYKPN